MPFSHNWSLSLCTSNRVFIFTILHRNIPEGTLHTPRPPPVEYEKHYLILAFWLGVTAMHIKNWSVLGSNKGMPLHPYSCVGAVWLHSAGTGVRPAFETVPACFPLIISVLIRPKAIFVLYPFCSLLFCLFCEMKREIEEIPLLGWPEILDYLPVCNTFCDFANQVSYSTPLGLCSTI